MSSAVLLASLLVSAVVSAEQLKYQVYNPQDTAVFPVSSTLISGQHDAILVDAQFSVKDAENLVTMVKDSGKTLKYIVITAGDPDFYFGLEPLVQAFPDAKVIASPQVVAHIESTKAQKFAYWRPILKDGAPKQVYVPEVYAQKTLKLEGEKIEFKAPTSYAAYLWVPSNRTLLGGVGVTSGIHVWTADTQSVAARNQWRATLKEMQALHPKAVIPGHYMGDIPKGLDAIQFSYQYLTDFDEVLKTTKESKSVIAAMQDKYANLAGVSSLELSSQVNTGEVEWK